MDMWFLRVTRHDVLNTKRRGGTTEVKGIGEQRSMGYEVLESDEVWDLRY